ncbi:MAG TPA: ATP-binding protein [Candidatus Acidoferrales bacterium]|nr:ATP-binding protein [Candidatus Acidoferrales bacterium]
MLSPVYKVADELNAPVSDPASQMQKNPFLSRVANALAAFRNFAVSLSNRAFHAASRAAKAFASFTASALRRLAHRAADLSARANASSAGQSVHTFFRETLVRPVTSLPMELRRGLRLFLDFLAAIRDHIYGVAANVKLRTKFLLSLVVVTSALMAGTLLVVGRVAKLQVEQQIEEQSHNAASTFQVMQHQREVALRHKAELLATLAVLRNGDPTAISTASEDPWQSEDCNLFLMTDPHGSVLALHTTLVGDFNKRSAEVLLRQSLRAHRTTDWWVGDGHLYQIVLKPVIAGPDQGNAHLGTVVVGSLVDNGVAGELHRISATEVAFRRGNQILVSTFSPLEERDLEEQSTAPTAPQQVEIEGQKYIADAVPLNPGVAKDEEVSLVVLKSYNEGIAYLAKLNRLLLWLLLATVIVGAIVVLIISDTFTRPLKALVGGVRALETGDYQYPLKPSGNDEVAQVTRAFGRMRTTLQSNDAERSRLEEQLRRSQRMEAMGRLAGGVAHDFNNLLTVIKGHCDFLLDKLSPADDLRSSGQQIAKAADRAASLTRQLLIFSRKQTTQPRVLDLNNVVSEMGKLLMRLVREDIDFSFTAGKNIGHVKADPCHLEQVVMNLVVNACDAMPDGGKLNIQTYDFVVDTVFAETHSPLQPGKYVVLAVSDTGCGIDEQLKAHIFEPFFTTKGEGKGTGLGLATVYGAVKQSNGFVWVDSEVGKGARFEVYFPRTDAPLDAAPSAGASPVSWRTETVLIVEDEDGVRELACEYVRSAGYKVLAARDGLEALALVERPDQPVHILLADVVMPQMRGPELAHSLRARRPNLKVVFMSGYLEYEKDAEVVAEGKLFLEKPFTRDALVLKLEAALANGSAASAPSASSDFIFGPAAGSNGANSNGAASKSPARDNGAGSAGSARSRSSAEPDESDLAPLPT